MKRNYFLAIVFFVCCSIKLFAQTSNWSWARSGIGAGQDEGFSVCTDSNGNGFVAGYFNTATIVFGVDTLISASLNQGNIFLVKYDPGGNVLWARSVVGAGGTYPDMAWSVNCDASGNVLISGDFWSPALNFGSVTLTNSDPSGHFGNAFVAKYDANGNALWAKSGIGPTAYNYNRAFSVCADSVGNVYITGMFDGPSISFGTDTIYGPGLFLVRYDANGNEMWSRSSPGGKGSSVIVKNDENLFVTGFNFGGVLISDYDTSGNLLTTQIMSGGEGFSSSEDPAGNVFVTGHFWGNSIIFGADTLLNMDTSGVYDDMFVVKFDANENVLWAKSGRGATIEKGYSISTDPNGNAFVSGGFSSPYIIFDSDTLFRIPASPDPAFIAGFDPNGNVFFSTALRSGGDDQNAISTDLSGNLFFGGDFMSNHLVLGNDTLVNGGAENIFLAKYSFNIEMGTGDFIDKKAINIYPNPFNSSTTIQFNSRLKNGVVELYNLYGQKIKSIENISADKIEITRENLPDGIYFIRVLDESKLITTEKVIIAE